MSDVVTELVAFGASVDGATTAMVALHASVSARLAACKRLKRSLKKRKKKVIQLPEVNLWWASGHIGGGG